MLSNAYCYINGKLIDIIKGSVTTELDKIGEIEFEIPAQSIDYRDVRGSDVRVFVNGDLYATGIAMERPSFKYMDNKNTVLSIKCYDELGRLGCIRAKTDAFYQDTLITSIIQNLMLFAPNWALDFSSFTDSLTRVTTVDLRDKESLFAQLVTTVETIPDLHLRFEGFDGSGNPILGVGYFNRVLYSAQQGINITELSLDANSTRIYNEVEAFGGFSAEKRITLADSLNDPRTTAHPDYVDFPIVNVGGFYVTRNNGLTSACGVAKKFDLQRTKNDTKPTQTEINEAAFALWQKSVQFLKQVDNKEVYSCGLVLSQKPLVGERIFVNAFVVEMYYDESLCWLTVPVASVESDYRITSIKTDLESYQIPNEFGCGDAPNLLIYDLQITNGSGYEDYDSEIELYERLDKSQQVNSGDVLQISPIISLSVNHNGADASDCNDPASGIINGKTFTFVPTQQPTWATRIFYAITSMSPSGVIYKEVQFDTNDINLPIILCVAPSGGDWNTLSPTDIITVNLLIYYS